MVAAKCNKRTSVFCFCQNMMSRNNAFAFSRYFPCRKNASRRASHTTSHKHHFDSTPSHKNIPIIQRHTKPFLPYTKCRGKPDSGSMRQVRSSQHAIDVSLTIRRSQIRACRVRAGRGGEPESNVQDGWRLVDFVRNGSRFKGLDCVQPK